MRARRCDFHTHTTFSDGELLPMELIRRAAKLDHRAIAITDHASFSNFEWIIDSVARDCKKADAWGIEAIPGVELTHIPVRYIDEAVRKSKKAGAEVILIHGETPVEPVEAGTNHEAVSNPDVDILAHPGMIVLDDAELAAKNSVYLGALALKRTCCCDCPRGQGKGASEHGRPRAHRPQYYGDCHDSGPWRGHETRGGPSIPCVLSRRVAWNAEAALGVLIQTPCLS